MRSREKSTMFFNGRKSYR